MIKKVILTLFTLGVLTVSFSCSDDDDTNQTSELTLNLAGLEELGSDYVYEGWIIVNGNPVSTGTFSSVNFPQTFSVNEDDLTNATKFVLSIEPAQDSDPAPAATKLLAGDFVDDTANVNSMGIVGDFTEVSGKYILATPTDTDDTNEASGVWFLDNSSGSAVAGLNLPELSDGWKYEGWVVVDGTPITTGTFSKVDMADDNAATSIFKGEANNGPAYPGEDYLNNAPNGLVFPLDLKDKTIVISVEPNPDNSAAPFTLKPLAHTVPTDADNHKTITMGDGPVNKLTGVVSR